MQSLGRRIVFFRAVIMAVLIHAFLIFLVDFEDVPAFNQGPPVVNFDYSEWGGNALVASLQGHGIEGVGEDQYATRPTTKFQLNTDGFGTDSFDEKDLSDTDSRRALLSNLSEEEVQRFLGGTRWQAIRRLRANSDLDTPATRYLNRWQRNVESVAALHLPRGMEHLKGTVTVRVIINSTGQLILADIVEPSVNPRLNQIVLEVLRLSSPYAPFNRELLQEADEVEIIRRWVFLGDATTDASESERRQFGNQKDAKLDT